MPTVVLVLQRPDADEVLEYLAPAYSTNYTGSAEDAVIEMAQRHLGLCLVTPSDRSHHNRLHRVSRDEQCGMTVFCYELHPAAQVASIAPCAGCDDEEHDLHAFALPTHVPLEELGFNAPVRLPAPQRELVGA